MKKLFLLLSLLLLPLFLFGQTSNLTATITDTDGQTWNNGTYKIEFVGIPGVSQYYWNGVAMTNAQQTFQGGMSGSGVITNAIPDSTTVAPSGTQWRFTLCPQSSAGCSVVTTIVSGGAPNLSATLSANLASPRFFAQYGAYGYRDGEVTGTPAPGAYYWNTVSNISRQWTGSAWQDWAGGGAVVPAGIAPAFLGYGTSNVPTPVTLPIYSGPLLGVPEDGTSDSCAALTTPVTGALAKVSSVGPAGLQLSAKALTLTKTCDIHIPSNVVLYGVDTVGAFKNAQVASAGGLDVQNPGAQTDAMITGWARGIAGLVNMYVTNHTNNRLFMQFTCAQPRLYNVLFIGETAGNTGAGCADGGACPDNDGIEFGYPGAVGTASCNATNDSYDAYGMGWIEKIMFKNMRRWMLFNDNANGITASNLRGDGSDGDLDTVTYGSAIYLNGVTNLTYANTITDVQMELVNKIGSSCSYPKGVFRLGSNATKNKLYAAIGDSNCNYNSTVDNSTSNSNFIEIRGSEANIDCVDDGDTNNNIVTCSAGFGKLKIRNLFPQNIGVVTVPTINSGISKLYSINGGVLGWYKGSSPWPCDMGLSRGGTGGYIKVGNCTASDSTGKIGAAAFFASGTAATLTGTGACASRASQAGGATAGTVQCTGTTGASTLIITTGVISSGTGYSCWANDITAGHLLAGVQSATSATAATMTFTSVTANDILTFGCLQF